MKLVVHEIDSEVYQEVTPRRNYIITHIRPHLYRHQWPSGNLKLQIQDANGEVLAESTAVTIADIGTLDYFHGYVRFDIEFYMKKEVTYRIAVVGSAGYTFDNSAFCGVCNDFDLRRYEALFTPNDGVHAPLDIEFWGRRT
jgi:predicted  nucleic acid-binding Zn ribbon protein